MLGKEVAKERNTLLPDDVTQDERGLRKLIEEGCFRSAVNLTSRLLGIYGQGVGRLGQPAKHTPHSLQLWFTRFNLLVKLGLFEMVTAEAEAFQQLSRPDLFYDFYAEMYNGRKGSMASFTFRLLLAELPMYVGQEKIALDNLSNVNSVCKQIMDHLSLKGDAVGTLFWKRRYARSLQSMVNCSLVLKNYGLVHSLMKQLEDLQMWTSQELQDLHSTWCRIYLQCGDIFNADQQHTKSRLQTTTNSSNLSTRDLLDKGLRSVAQNDFEDGLNFFQNALRGDPHNVTVSGRERERVVERIQGPLYIMLSLQVLNNIAVCQLYTGKLDEAIKTFERAIDDSTASGLNEYLVVNLSTLYELQSSNAMDKKQQLLKKLNQQKGDLSLNLDYCLKLKLSN